MSIGMEKSAEKAGAAGGGKIVERVEQRVITLEELGKHNTAEDCWVAVHGQVIMGKWLA